MLWYSLEGPDSNEYPQYMVSCRNKKNIMWYSHLSEAMQIDIFLSFFSGETSWKLCRGNFYEMLNSTLYSAKNNNDET